MTVYVIVQLKMTDRAVYDRHQFFDVCRKFSGQLLSADEHPLVLEGAWDRDKLVLPAKGFTPGRLAKTVGYHHHGPKPKPSGNGAGA